MVTLLLILFLAVTEMFVPTHGTMTLVRATPARLAEIAKGRILIWRVKKGMNRKQADEILGPSSELTVISMGSMIDSHDSVGVAVHFGEGGISEIWAVHVLFRKSNP